MYNQTQKSRRTMEFSLQFFVGFEIILSFVGYLVKDCIPVVNSNIDDSVYFGWMALLLLANFIPMISYGPIKFAVFRVIFKCVQMYIVFLVHHLTGQVMFSNYVIGYHFLEILYLIEGISRKKMDFPGRIMSSVIAILKKYFTTCQGQESDSQQNVFSDNEGISLETNPGSDNSNVTADPIPISNPAQDYDDVSLPSVQDSSSLSTIVV